MIEIEFYKNEKGQIYGFSVEGHAGFDAYGKDIVCSAVSVLVLNTINSLERFTKAVLEVNVNEKNGKIICKIPILKTGDCHDCSLLVQSMAYGLMDIETEYKDFVHIIGGVNHD